VILGPFARLSLAIRSCYRRWPMADPTAIAALLLEMPQGVCVDCIVLKTGIEPGDVRATFHRLAGFVRVVARPGRCCACSKRTMVFAMTPAALSLGDVVTSRLHPDRAGEVVSTARIDNGHVSVRWRSPSGIATSDHGRLGTHQLQRRADGRRGVTDSVESRLRLVLPPPAASPALRLPEPEAAEVEPERPFIDGELVLYVRLTNNVSAYAASCPLPVAAPELLRQCFGQGSFVKLLADDVGGR
jgi:hypothetical protein